MNTTLVVFVVLYLLGTLALGVWAGTRIKNTSDFAIAGRSLPLIMVVTTTFATWFGAETVMGIPAKFVQGGLNAVVEDPFGAGTCLILVGLFFAVCTLALIAYGKAHYGSVAVGTSMGLTAFSLLLVTSAFHARSVTASTFTQATFDNRQLNWTALAEVALAVLITQMDALRRVFGTVQLSDKQWALALVPAVVLFFVWELGKLIARRHSEREQGTMLADS